MCESGGYDVDTPLCYFKDDPQGGLIIYGIGRPSGKTPLYLAYIPYLEFDAALKASNEVPYVYYFNGTIDKNDKRASWSEGLHAEHDAAPLPLYYWRDKNLPCDGYDENHNLDLGEFSPIASCRGQDTWLPESCGIHKTCWYDSNGTDTLKDDDFDCNWTNADENENERQVFGMTSAVLITEKVDDPTILLFYSGGEEEQYWKDYFDPDIDRQVSTFYRTALLSRPWKLSARIQAKNDKDQPLNGYGPYIIEKITKYTADYKNSGLYGL